MLKDFIVEDKYAHFTLEIIDKSEDAETFCFDEDNDDFYCVKFKKQGQGYLVTAELNIKESKEIFEIGFIDINNRDCKFYDINAFFTEKLLAAFYRSCFNFFLNDKNGFLLHASAIVKDDFAYIFSGPGGSGKSTMALLSKPLKIIADDFVCVRRIKDGFFAYATPWHETTSGNNGYKIKSIFFLEKSKNTEFILLDKSKIIYELLGNLYYNVLDDSFKKTVPLFSEIYKNIKSAKLKFFLEDDLWGCINNWEKSYENARSSTYQIA